MLYTNNLAATTKQIDYITINFIPRKEKEGKYNPC